MATLTDDAPRPFIDVRTALSALWVLARDHTRLDQVLRLGEAVNRPVFPRLWKRFESTEEGRRVLRDRPRIDDVRVDFGALAALPAGTLGHEYARFLRENGISSAPFRDPPDVRDERAQYLMLRMRQQHDLWHVITGYGPDVRGEILLQAFTFAQVGAPISFLIAVLGTIRYGIGQRRFLRDLRRAYRAGRAARMMPTTYWEEHWEDPVPRLRERFGVPLGGVAGSLLE